MRRPWEVTEDEARREADESRERLQAADREAAPLLNQMMAEWDAEEEVLSDEDPSEAESLDASGFTGFADRHDRFMANHPDFEEQTAEDFRLIMELRERASQDIPEADPPTED